MERGYSDVRFDFEPLEAPDFAMRASWSLDHMLGYLSTWSAAKRYQERRGEDPVARVSSQLGNAWGDPQSTVEIGWPLAVRLWRVDP